MDRALHRPQRAGAHLGHVEGLRVLLVEGQDSGQEFGELLLQLFARQQVAHRPQSLHHSEPELKGRELWCSGPNH